MAKGETKETYRDVKRERQEDQAAFTGAIGQSNENAGALQPQISSGQQQLTQGYTDMAGGGGGLAYKPMEMVPEVTYNNIGNAGTIDSGNLNTNLDRWKGFAQTGGITPETQAAIGGDISQIRDLSGVSALTPEAIARMRGNGVYDEFAATGGLSGVDRANIQSAALAPIGGMAAAARDEMKRRQALTGGYAPGMDAANRQIQRDAARGITEASLNSKLAVLDRVNQGRLAGAGGLASSEANVVGATQGDLARRTQGFQTAANTQMAVQDLTSKYMAMGMSGEAATAKAIADVEAQNIQNENQINMFNAGNQLQTQMFNTGNKMQVGQFNTGNQLGVDQFNITNPQQQQASGLAGLQGVNNVNVGMYENERDRSTNLLGAGSQSNLGYLNQQGGLATQPGIGGNIANLAGAGLGIASNFFMPGQRVRAAVQ